MTIRPTRTAVLLAFLALPVALLPAVFGDGSLYVWVSVMAGILLVIGADLLLGFRWSHLEIRIVPPSAIHLGEEEPLVVIARTGVPGSPRRLEVLAELSGLLAPQPLLGMTLGSDGRGRMEVPLHPRRRGTAGITALWVRGRGPLGLTERIRRIAVDREVPVIPNVRAVRAAAIRHFRSREFLVGQKTTKLAGDGSEFDSLREFLPGHDHRTIHWKSSARHMKLLAREFRAERDNRVILAFDTGHVMREPIEGIPRLDHAINSGLLLAFACLKTGDRVGLFAFDEEVRLFAPPRRGIGSLPEIQHLLAGMEYSTAETNFTLGLTTLLGRLSRRSLIVVFTELMDSVMVELMLENLGRLAGRHLVLCMTLRDPELAATAAACPDSLLSLNRTVVAGDLLRDRDLAISRLGRLGVHCIDASARRAPGRLIDRYLFVKRKELV